MKQDEKLCSMDTVREFTYLCEKVSAGGECDVAVTAREICWLVKFGECGELP